MTLGSGNAAYRLGWMYEHGFLSEEPDYVKAMASYEKAASLGNADGYCRAALYLANGYAGVKDAEKSKKYYEKAAEMGACFALVELAFLYENGDGVEKDYKKLLNSFIKQLRMNILMQCIESVFIWKRDYQ